MKTLRNIAYTGLLAVAGCSAPEQYVKPSEPKREIIQREPTLYDAIQKLKELNKKFEEFEGVNTPLTQGLDYKIK